jgi:hypothetical protein
LQASKEVKPAKDRDRSYRKDQYELPEHPEEQAGQSLHPRPLSFALVGAGWFLPAQGPPKLEANERTISKPTPDFEDLQ